MQTAWGFSSNKVMCADILFSMPYWRISSAACGSPTSVYGFFSHSLVCIQDRHVQHVSVRNCLLSTIYSPFFFFVEMHTNKHNFVNVSFPLSVGIILGQTLAFPVPCCLSCMERFHSQTPVTGLRLTCLPHSVTE